MIYRNERDLWFWLWFTLIYTGSIQDLQRCQTPRLKYIRSFNMPIPYIFNSLAWPDPFSTGCLSIRDYKRPLWKGLVNWLYLFHSGNIQILYMSIGDKLDFKNSRRSHLRILMLRPTTLSRIPKIPYAGNVVHWNHVQFVLQFFLDTMLSLRKLLSISER